MKNLFKLCFYLFLLLLCAYVYVYQKAHELLGPDTLEESATLEQLGFYMATAEFITLAGAIVVCVGTVALILFLKKRKSLPQKVLNETNI